MSKSPKSSKGAPRREDAPTRRRGRGPMLDDGPRRGDRRAERRPLDAPARDRRPKNGRSAGPARDQRALRPAGPPTAPMPRVAPAKSTSQAKARAKARKAKAPKVVRLPLRDRLRARLLRLAQIDLNPRALLTRVPFVVLVIGALGLGLGMTLWLSTDAAERSYQLGRARVVNQALQQQKEALERQVLEAQAAPALAEAARNLGMIPSRDTAHLVQDPGGNWIVVGTPKPAQGVPPAPLNFKLPDEAPPAAGAIARTTRSAAAVTTSRLFASRALETTRRSFRSKKKTTRPRSATPSRALASARRARPTAATARRQCASSR